MGWNYQREESNNSFSVIPEGNHRIRIASAEKAQSKTGKDMLRLKFDVSGYAGYLFHNIVFLPDRPEITNGNLTRFFDSFKDIGDGNFDLASWVGKVGAATVVHEEYNGNTQARIKYFIHKDRQADMPAWVEPSRKSDGGSGNGDASGGVDSFVNVPGNLDDEIPFK